MARVAIKFNFSTLNQNTKIQKATFKMYKIGHYSNATENYSIPATYNIHKITSDWNESTATWESWNAIGGDIDPTPSSSFDYNGTLNNDWFIFDVTKLIQNMINTPTSNFGFMIDVPGGDDEGGASMDQDSYFISSNTDNLSLAPILTIKTNPTDIDISSAKTGNPSIKLALSKSHTLQVSMSEKGIISIFSLNGKKIYSTNTLKGITEIDMVRFSNSCVIVNVTQIDGEVKKEVMQIR